MFDINIGIILTTIFFYVVLGLAAFLQKPGEKVNRVFLLMTLFIAVWQFSNFLENESVSLTLAKIFLRIDFASAVIVGYCWFLFVLNFSQAKRIDIKPFFKFLFFSVAIFLSLLSFTNLVILNIHFNNGAIVFDMGYLWFLYGWGVVGFFIAGYIIIILNLLKSQGLAKVQTLYVFLGFSISSVFALVINLFLANYLTINQARIGLYGAIIFVLCSFYAIIKHHLFNIKVIATELFTLALWIVLLVRIFLSADSQGLIINTLVFAAVVIVGVLLVRSVIKEVEQREKIEKISKELERAYVVEKKANIELENLDKYKNDFLRQVQHDLKNPLTVIMGYIDLLLGGNLGKVPQKGIEILKRMDIVAQEKIKDVNNFLDTEQFKMGKKVVTLKPGVEVLPIIKEIADRLKYQAELKGISLNLELPERDFTISADREKLKSAIFNVVDNSVKYTEKGGVNIKVTDGNIVKIIISDTGIGIPQDKLKTIFETQFERTKEAQKMASGTGVGLHLSAQIIKLHNGKIWAESEGEGKGSTFYIELPVE